MHFYRVFSNFLNFFYSSINFFKSVVVFSLFVQFLLAGLCFRLCQVIHVFLQSLKALADLPDPIPVVHTQSINTENIYKDYPPSN